MTTTLVIIVFALAAVLLLLRAARGHAQIVRELSQLEGLTRPVDLAAFRNLLHPADDEYLRAHLHRKQFRSVQRQRLRAALDYVDRTAHNASVLLRLGEGAQQSHDPEIAAAGRELANGALLLRIYAKLAMPVLYARIILPGSHISVGHLVDMYETVTAGLVRLTRLQNPAYVGRIATVV
ncbi:MAG TPA: hypothetical protein VE734_12890 [Terriglobales bacterium]|nr:hypothetical protein [Terriglobales bacterium]